MFKKFKKEFVKHSIRFDQKILIAVSGGVDSMVLWELMHKANHIYGVAHVNFSLRGEDSDGDEELIRKIATERNTPFYSIKVDTKSYAATSKSSIQMAAREIRYDFFNQLFEEHGFESLATAHHLEDNFETFLINLNRGAGIKGLKGISSNSRKFRPLLGFTKDEIRAYAKENEINFREDKSNADLKYERNWFRHEVIKPWLERNPSIFKTMKQNFKHLNESFEIIEEKIEKNTTQLKKELQSGYFKISTLKKLKRKNYYLFQTLLPYGFNSLQVNSLLNCIKRNEVGKVFKSTSHQLILERKKVELMPRSNDEKSIEPYFLLDKDSSLNSPFPVNVISIEPFMFQPSSNNNVETFDKSKLEFPLVLRKWQKGDLMKPIGMKGKKKVSKMLSDLKLTTRQKAETYVVLSGERIIWLVNHRIDERFKVSEKSEQLLQITIG